MSMDSPTQDSAPIRPSTETNLLLGQLMAKVDGVAEEQRSERLEVSALRAEIADVKADVAVLKSHRTTRGPWWAVLSGVGSLVAIVTAVGAAAIFFSTN